jgi:hypothetical protein
VLINSFLNISNNQLHLLKKVGLTLYQVFFFSFCLIFNLWLEYANQKEYMSYSIIKIYPKDL